MSSATLRFNQGVFWTPSKATPDARTLRSSTTLHPECSYQIAGTGREARLKLALLEAAEEASAPDWDGYGGTPLDPRAGQYASAFLISLPASTPLPEIGATPEGSIELDWWGPGDQVVSAVIDAAGTITFSSILNRSRSTGVAMLHEEITPQFFEELQRVLHPR